LQQRVPQTSKYACQCQVVVLYLSAADIFKKMGRGNSRAQISVEDVSSYVMYTVVAISDDIFSRKRNWSCLYESRYAVTVILLWTSAADLLFTERISNLF